MDFMKSETDASAHRKKALDSGVQSLLKDFVGFAEDEKCSGVDQGLGQSSGVPRGQSQGYELGFLRPAFSARLQTFTRTESDMIRGFYKANAYASILASLLVVCEPRFLNRVQSARVSSEGSSVPKISNMSRT